MWRNLVKSLLISAVFWASGLKETTLPSRFAMGVRALKPSAKSRKGKKVRVVRPAGVTQGKQVKFQMHAAQLHPKLLNLFPS